MRICKNELTDQLRSMFNANPLRIPESIYQPLLVLEIINKKPQPLGQFEELVKGKYNHNLDIITSEVAEFSGQQTKKVNSKLGLDILGGFIKAFGAEPAKINIALNKAKSLNFSFSNVERRRFSPLLLGKILAENEVFANPNNMFVDKIMKDRKSKLAIVTDVITSNSFSINVFDEKDNDIEIDIPIIENYLTNLDIEFNIDSTKTNEIKFTKDTPLTFAFSCVEILIDENGKFSSADWITKIKARGSANTRTKERIEHDAKILFDDDQANPLLI